MPFSYTYPLTPPAALKMATITVRQVAATAIHTSPDTFSMQIQERIGQRWEFDVDLPPMKRATAAEVIGFLLSLNGPVGTFYLGDHSCRAPRGTATPGSGGPRTSGVQDARSYSMATTGWAVSQAAALRAGDWLQVGTGSSVRLHMVTEDCASDSSGNATVKIWPRTRTAYPANTTLVTASPVGLFRLTEPVTWTVEQARMYGMRFSVMEAL